MLGKLIKNDLKYTSKAILGAIFSFCAFVILGMIFSQFSGLFPMESAAWEVLRPIQFFFTMPVVGLIIALMVIFAIMAVSQFTKNLYGNEGYLTLTLPVSTKKLLLSKLMVCMIWAFVCGLVILFLLFGFARSFDTLTIMTGAESLVFSMQTMMAMMDGMKILQFMINGMFTALGAISIIMLVSALGHIPYISNRRWTIPFMVIGWIVLFNISQVLIERISGTNSINTWLTIITGVVYLCISIISFFVSSAVLEKKRCLTS